MTGEEINKIATTAKDPPDELNGVERGLFWEFKELYRRFDNGEISREQGSRLKKEAMARFREENEKLKKATEIWENHARMWKEIEGAGSKYRLEPTIENADAFLKAVYGVGRKEAVIYE